MLLTPLNLQSMKRVKKKTMKQSFLSNNEKKKL